MELVLFSYGDNKPWDVKSTTAALTACTLHVSCVSTEMMKPGCQLQKETWTEIK